jgi:hypothetical protein
MRGQLLSLAGLALGFAACGAGNSGTVHDGSGGVSADAGGQADAAGAGSGGATGGSGGTRATGGVGATGGSSGAGAGGMAAGGAGGSAPTASQGSATLRLKLAPGSAYCDDGCPPTGHIGLGSVSAPKGSMTIVPPCGSVFCDTCLANQCPGSPCGPRTVQDNEELTWDGTYYEASRCGPQAMGCWRKTFAAAGQYIAIMCATPGTISQPDGGGLLVCTKTGDLQCVEVPFTFPSSTPVVGTLGGGGGPIRCGSATCAGDNVCVNPCCGGTAPPCLAIPDGGVCPVGSSQCTTPGGGPGCVTPCTPPPPFCQPASKALPAGCILGKDRQAVCGCA